MDVTKLPTGKDAPSDIYVVIEIPQGSAVKYELDKDSGAIMVDRFLFTPMAYPAAYGFIPGTIADDGDPVDAMVLTPTGVVPGSVIRARPIGVLLMSDEAGQDEKLICVPHDKISSMFSKVEKVEDLPELLVKQIEHFFTRYKDLEKGKWVKVEGWADKARAEALILAGIEAAKKA